MEQYSEKPRKKNNLPYLVVAGIILAIGAVSFFAQPDVEPSKFKNEPDAIATDTAQILEIYPELDGWNRLTDREVAIWMPATYENETIAEAIKLAEQGSEFLSEELQGFEDILADNPEMIRFVAYDTDPENFLSGNNVLVARESAGRMSMDRYTELSMDNLPGGAQIQQQPIDIRLEHYTARRIMYTIDVMLGFEVTSIIYIVQTNGFFYLVNFTTMADQVDDMLPITQQAINTFRVY